MFNTSGKLATNRQLLHVVAARTAVSISIKKTLVGATVKRGEGSGVAIAP